MHPTNASAIAWPNLSHRSRRDVRAVQWSNDALSTLLDLYEEKYFAFGPWIFSNQGLGKHSKKACDTFLQKVRGQQLNVVTNGTRWKRNIFKKRQHKVLHVLELLHGFVSIRWTKIWKHNKGNGTPNGLDQDYVHVESSQTPTIEKDLPNDDTGPSQIGNVRHNPSLGFMTKARACKGANQ
jgi:hypothetical protein